MGAVHHMYRLSLPAALALRALLALGFPNFISFIISLVVLIIRGRTLLVLPFILFAFSIILLLAVLDLVIDQVVESRNGANQTADVNVHKLVVGLDAHRTSELSVLELDGFRAVESGAGLGCSEVGEEIEDVLEVAQDGMVDGKFSIENLLQVCSNITEP